MSPVNPTELTALFNTLGNDSQSFLAQAEKIEDSHAFLTSWAAFIDHYGARGSSEIDIAIPRWYEEPLPLLQVIASYLKSRRRQSSSTTPEISRCPRKSKRATYHTNLKKGFLAGLGYGLSAVYCMS